MAPHDMAHRIPGRVRGPCRSTLFFVLGAVSFLTLCFFTAHLPALQQLTGPFGPMTSLGAGKATAPHHDYPDGHAPKEEEQQQKQQMAEFLQLLLDHSDSQQAPSKMAYGTNKHPSFRDDPPLLVGDLPAVHIPSYAPSSPTGSPGGGNGENKRGKRLVVVGDVHGYLDALKTLLRKIGFDKKKGDHLVLVGDMVTKGPDSKGVVELAMKLGASAVRGNQEDKVLAAAREIHRLSVDGGIDGEADDQDDGEVDTDIRKKHAHRIARSLSRAQLAWLRALPIILRIDRLPDATSAPWNASTLAVVHGGLVPGLPLKKQDPWAVMNMRSLVYPGKKKDLQDNDSTTTQIGSESTTPDAVAVPISGHEGEPWSRAWSRQQNHLPPSSAHTVVIYGHDARAGLQVSREVNISPYHQRSRSKSSSSELSSGDEGEEEEEENNEAERKPVVDELKETQREEDDSGDFNDQKSNDKNKKKNKNKKKKKKTKKEMGLRYAFGLDSGCGHGRHLTALVIEAVAPGVVEHRVEQVACVDAHSTE